MGLTARPMTAETCRYDLRRLIERRRDADPETRLVITERIDVLLDRLIEIEVERRGRG